MSSTVLGDKKLDRKAALEAVFRRRAEGKVWAFDAFPHQWDGACYGAVAKRWILGDEVGVGKTRTAIGWLDLVGAKKVVLVCEANIANQFAGEVQELAPHRKVVSLNGLSPETRHKKLDELAYTDAAVIVVNFEMFRTDRKALAKVTRWRADTLIVDEAHNLKATKTGNFKNIQIIAFFDNVCPRCNGSIEGLYDIPYYEQSGRKRPSACPSCGWRKGDETGAEYPSQLAEALSTKSLQNICFLTGTPILNNPGDLYALVHLIDPVTWPTYADYAKRYLEMNYASGRLEWKSGMLEVLRQELRGRFLQRKKTDVGEVLPNGDIRMPNGSIIPQQRVKHISVEMDPQRYPLQFRTIRQITERAMIQLSNGDQHNIMAVIAVMTRKRQANVWPAGIEIRDTDKDSPTYGDVLFSVGDEVRESAKLDVIEQQIFELWQQGKRQLAFSQFTTALDELEKRLVRRGMRVARMDGTVTKKQREVVKTDFDRKKLVGKPKYDVLLAQYRSGGTGLNFTAATEVHVIDEEWSPGKRTQAYGRTHRIGQDEESTVYVYRLRGTIDQWLANLIHSKERMIKDFEDGAVVSLGKDEVSTGLIEGMKDGSIL